MAGQSAPRLLTALEGLAALRTRPTEQWLEAFAAASLGVLHELSLPQLAATLLHLRDLNVALPAQWWQSWADCTVSCAHAACSDGAGGGDERIDDGFPASKEQRSKLLRRPCADALCACLWGCGDLPGQPLTPPWMRACLLLLLPALTAGRCSAAATVQLLHTCCVGAVQVLPDARRAAAACLVCLSSGERLRRVCSNGATLDLLLDSLRSLQSASGAAAGTLSEEPPSPLFWQGLEFALAGAAPSLLPNQLCTAAAVLAAHAQTPGPALASALALASGAALPWLPPAEASALVCDAAALRLPVPQSWLAAAVAAIGPHRAQEPQLAAALALLAMPEYS